MAPSAGTGSMKNVIGTSSAVAIVAVSPGIAPTNMPKAAEAMMTQRTLGSKIEAAAAGRRPCRPHRIVFSQPRGSGTRSSVAKNQ